VQRASVKQAQHGHRQRRRADFRVHATSLLVARRDSFLKTSC
jgi:hypothetical protein